MQTASCKTNRPPVPWRPIIAGIASFAVGAILYHNPGPPPPQLLHVRDGALHVAVNTQSIRWIRQNEDCFYICTKPHGCSTNPNWNDKFSVCKGMDDYDKVSAWYAGPSL